MLLKRRTTSWRNKGTLIGLHVLVVWFIKSLSKERPRTRYMFFLIGYHDFSPLLQVLLQDANFSTTENFLSSFPLMSH